MNQPHKVGDRKAKGMKTFPTGWLIALGIVFTFARGVQADDVAAVRKVLDEQVQAWNKGDLEGFMNGYWQSDKLTFYSGKNKGSGWKETLDRYRKRYQSDGKEMGRLEFKEVHVELLDARHALVKGEWHLTLKKEKPNGLFTLILRKTDAGWRIIHDHTSN